MDVGLLMETALARNLKPQLGDNHFLKNTMTVLFISNSKNYCKTVRPHFDQTDQLDPWIKHLLQKSSAVYKFTVLKVYDL